MPTKQELKKFIDELRSTLPFLATSTNFEYVNGIRTTLSVIEQEFNLNDTGVNLEG